VFSGANVVLMALAVGTLIPPQKHARELWLVIILGAVPVLTNGLIEPRYLIPAAGLFLLFFDFAEIDARRLAVWWAVLCALHAPFVVKALSLW
jgi:hypothetical protein